MCAARSRSTFEIIRRVLVYLLPYKLLAIGTLGCALLSTGSALVYPKLTQLVIDNVLRQNRLDLLTPVVSLLIAALLLRDLFNSLRIRINNAFEQNVIYDMRRQVFGQLQRLPVNYFDHRASGDLMTRVLEDVNSVERLLIDGTEQGTVAILSILGVGVILFVTQPVLAAIALLPLPFLVGGALWYTLTAHRRYRAQRDAASAMNALLLDDLQGIRQIKAFGREDHEDGRFATRADTLRKSTLGIMRVWATYSPAMSFAGAMGMVLVWWVGGRMVLRDQLTLGQLVAFQFYLALFYEPISRLHSLNQMLQSARASGERVFDILDTSQEQTNTQPRTALRLPVAGEVRYEGVEFGYGPHRQVLHDIRLLAQPGEMIALVGPTGAGKSTLVNLLCGFYRPAAGRILVDNQDITEVSLESLRAQISVVSQEPFLFNGTLRENILFGRLNASEEELIGAAKAANCHEFILRQPKGYDSWVGERGIKLSVGEKQRVSIARALLKNSPILLLDEATASVDTATERLIQEALEHLLANRTSFVIAHRLSTIRKANQILVMHHGRITERGTHESLLAAHGLYSKLARIQGSILAEDGFRQLLEKEIRNGTESHTHET